MGTPANILFLAAAAALPVLLGRMLQPALTGAMLRDLRLPRILHYVALAGMGMALYLHLPENSSALRLATTWMDFAGLMLALTYAAVFAIVSNNLEDLEADRISNPGRPLPLARVEPRPYLLAGVFCQMWGLGIALIVGWEAFLGVLGISLGYFVYSCRPFRLKRVPILSKLIIGINSWVVALCGYAMAGGDWTAFPLQWTVLLLGPLALAANFVDLKDTLGDKATGISTLPVLLGEAKARALIALATAASYIMGGILLGITWVYPLNALALVAHLFFLYRKPYDERWVFLVYVNALLGLDIFLFLGDQ